MAIIGTGPARAEQQSAAIQMSASPQGLWVIFGLGVFGEFQGKSLKKSGKPFPKLKLGFAECCPTFNDFAFDNSGSLWLGFIASNLGGAIGKLTPDELKPGKKPKPFSVLISYPGDSNGGRLIGQTSIAFDSAGNLWVAVPGMGVVFKYTPDQLLASGSPTPAATLHFTSNGSSSPAVIQFDSAGNLWLGYEYLPSFASATAVEFTAAQIADIQANGSPAPMLSVQLGSDIEYINSLVFDTQGNLWIAASTWAIDPNLMFGGVVEMFNVAGKSGTLSQPDVTITPSAISAINQSLDHPSSLAFDNQGSLWVSNPISSDLISGAQNSGGFIVKFSADQLTASGSPIPQTIITPNRKGSNFRFPALLLFGPTIK